MRWLPILSGYAHVQWLSDLRHRADLRRQPDLPRNADLQRYHHVRRGNTDLRPSGNLQRGDEHLQQQFDLPRFQYLHWAADV